MFKLKSFFRFRLFCVKELNSIDLMIRRNPSKKYSKKSTILYDSGHTVSDILTYSIEYVY